MCDRLVSRIDQVDAEVGGMADAWKRVEEGGKSLQDASQKLLDELVSFVQLYGLYERLMVFSCHHRIGWSNYREPSGRPWNISSNWSTRHVGLYSISPSSSKPTFSICSNLWTSVSSSSNPTYDSISAFASGSVAHTLVIAQLQSSGNLPLAFPAMHDPRHDTHQNVLCWLASRAHTRCLAKVV